jgi:DNA polymerase-3 subunit delta'
MGQMSKYSLTFVLLHFRTYPLAPLPKIPESIVGHEKSCGQLLSDIASKNVSHAYLFVGAKHLGKTTIAQWFAHLLLCEDVAPDQRAQVRKDMERFIHPDFLCLDDLWIDGKNDDWALITQSSNAPQHHRSKKPTAKSDTISIDDIRALTDKLQETSNSTYFVCIISGVERMNAEAANALLKMLEEPPQRVVFILTTNNLNDVMPTTISRTRILRFSPLSAAAMQPLLKERDEEEMRFARHIAQGAPGLMIRLLKDPELLRYHKQTHTQARHFWQTSSLKDRLSWIMAAAEKKGDPNTILLHLALTLREQPDPLFRAKASTAYAELLRKMETNAHHGLLLERFTLAIDTLAC